MVQQKQYLAHLWRWLAILLIGVMVIVGHPVQAASLPQDTVGNHYTVGLDDTSAPMGFRDATGELVGFDIDLAKAVAKLYDWELTFQPVDWSVKETELKAGTIDMIWNGYGITPEREQQVLLSEPYVSDSQVIVVPKDSPIHELSDLKGKRLALQSGSTAADYMKQWPQEIRNGLAGEPIRYQDNNQVLADVQAKRVDAAYLGEFYVRYILAKRGTLAQYRLITDPNAVEQMGVGLRKGDTELKQAIDAGIQELKANGTYQAIESRWFGASAMVNTESQPLLQRILPSLLEGLQLTVILFVLTLVLSLPLGLVLGMIRTFGPTFIRSLLNLYIFIMRGTPLMLQLMVVFFGLPFIGLSLPRFVAALLALVCNYAAYFAEIFRGGYQAVPSGQYESLWVLGIPRFRGFRRIILPQVLRTVFPSIGNEIISLIKDTSLVYVIGLGELLRADPLPRTARPHFSPTWLLAHCIYC